MQLAEIIIRLDMEATAKEGTRREAEAQGSPLARTLGRQLDALRTRRNELLDELEAQVGTATALAQMSEYRYELAGR